MYDKKKQLKIENLMIDHAFAEKQAFQSSRCRVAGSFG